MIIPFRSFLHFELKDESLLLSIFVILPVFAHYTLDYPPTTGFIDEQETNPLCGGFNPISTNVTTWPVSGGQILINSYHPEMTIIYRAQLKGSNTWVNLTNGFLAMVGIGKLCVKSLPVPGNWSGQIGVISTIGHPTDGILYQV